MTDKKKQHQNQKKYIEGKSAHILTAKALGYGVEVIEALENAESEYELDLIMRTTRNDPYYYYNKKYKPKKKGLL